MTGSVDRFLVLLYRFLAVAWLVLLFVLSNQPGSKIGARHPVDKILHIFAFGVLAFLIALGNRVRWRRFNLWMVPLAVASLGVVDEFHQSFVPGREVSGMDVAADAVGACFAVAFWWAANRQGAESDKPGDSTIPAPWE